jgi:hypothetical protein
LHENVLAIGETPFRQKFVFLEAIVVASAGNKLLDAGSRTDEAT